MSVAEMKIELIKKITDINSEVLLQEVSALLRNAVEKEPVSLSKNYDAIKAQYGEVLQKLAQ